MNLLVDTHTFLWFITDDPQLPCEHKLAIQHPDNLVFFSSVSATEVAIKNRIGKLSLPEAPESYIPRQRHNHCIVELTLLEDAALRLALLPLLHKDPFDRLLVCQTLAHGLTLATSDPLIRQYDIPVI